MNNIEFEKKLKELIPLVLRHASDFYELSKFKSLKQAFKSLRHEDFIEKCYEGFKIAQKKIIENIITVETDIEATERSKKILMKGKKLTALEKDPTYTATLQKIYNLRFQKATFHEVANVMVWTLLKMDRAHAKSFIQENGGSGYLKDKNLKSVVTIADKMNDDKNCFALICDISSILHSGDLIVVKKGRIQLIEVKDKSRMNDLVSSAAMAIVYEGEANPDLLEEIKLQSPKDGESQIERFVRQIKKNEKRC